MAIWPVIANNRVIISIIYIFLVLWKRKCHRRSGNIDVIDNLRIISCVPSTTQETFGKVAIFLY